MASGGKRLQNCCPSVFCHKSNNGAFVILETTQSQRGLLQLAWFINFKLAEAAFSSNLQVFLFCVLREEGFKLMNNCCLGFMWRVSAFEI